MKEKLSIKKQVEDMLNKGITFDKEYDLSQAENFLKKNTYYFKLKCYARNYNHYQSTNRRGQYINLDFSYLVELSTLDMYLRKIILNMALDIEHALKTNLLLDLAENDKEDGYHIVNAYLNADYNRVLRIHDKIGKSVTSDLVTKHQGEYEDTYALWEIVEVLSFGDFIDLYTLYYQMYPSKEEYSSFLWSVKFLRNAAAHNNCLINSLKAPYSINIRETKEIQSQIGKLKLPEKSKTRCMKNPVVHDFIVLVFVYLNVIKSSKMKVHGIDELNWLFHDRMLKNKSYFEKNNIITETYKFVTRAVDYMCNKYR